jgi:hypothetical protein
MRFARGSGVSVLGLILAMAGCGGGGGDTDAAVPVDAPPADRDAAPACTEDADCEDGLACNGESSCVEGRCVAGTPMRCDDGIACTTDFCSEELRRCVNRAVDADGDGVPAETCLDARGMPLGDDCDDDAATVFPGALEVCDAMNVDEDCDPDTLGGLDTDGDTFIDARCCNGATCGDDCNDAVRGANPDATEACNGIDDDCDGMVDDGLLVTVYRDADGDGHGDASMSRMGCGARAGYVLDDRDCDDTNALRSPSLPEVCDGIDNDCDGTPDPADSPVPATWYRDVDGDGFGDRTSFVISCAVPAGQYSLLGTDCNDADPALNPAQAERCNGRDDDCNGRADFAIPGMAGNLEDDDADGQPDAACGLGEMVSDCDDRDPLSGRGSAESCDGRDNDCDGRVDEMVASFAYFRDADGDGYGGTSGGVMVGCVPPTGFVARGGDCDDTSAVRFPGSGEGCNLADDDCDGAVDESPASSECSPTPRFEERACSAGACRVVGCVPDRGDCDGSPSNGCETDLTTDANCGTCGNFCEVGSCVSGECR